MKCETLEYTAPSAWASYLINGDASGIDADDIRAADAFVAWVDAGSPVDCRDAGFVHVSDARRYTEYAQYGADCQTYVFLRRVTP